MKPTFCLGFIFVLAGIAARAEESAAPAADLGSPEAVIQAVYSVISGPLGAPRDWARLRSLMAPGAIFAVTRTGKTGPTSTRVISVDEYISATSKALETTAFYEHGVTGPIWRYAHIAFASSPYESRHAPNEAPFQRGINTFQLSFDGTRWWIISVSWEGESAEFPLPADAAKLLDKK
jgi:hypothetical protein